MQSNVSNSFFKVQHPAAKLLILASDMQEKEVGDGTNFVIIFGSQLLQNAADLLQMVSLRRFQLINVFKTNVIYFFFQGLDSYRNNRWLQHCLETSSRNFTKYFFLKSFETFLTPHKQNKYKI